jgi:uncharacterized protein with HEPN domain
MNISSGVSIGKQFMWDKELVRELLEQVLWSVQTVSRRFGPIRSPDDFVASDEGLEKLDAVCMQLLAIGEGVKQVDRVTNGELFPRYPAVDWRSIMRMRDVISHHYYNLNAEVVFGVCEKDIEPLGKAIRTILDDLAAA